MELDFWEKSVRGSWESCPAFSHAETGERDVLLVKKIGKGLYYMRKRMGRDILHW